MMRIKIDDIIYNCHAIERIDTETDYILRVFFSEKSRMSIYFPNKGIRDNLFGVIYKEGYADLSEFY